MGQMHSVKVMLSSFGLVLLFALSACSVKGGSVPSAPPDIQPREQSLEFGVDAGTFQSDSFSLLIWPNDWTPAQRQEKTLWIKVASNQAIQDLVTIATAPTKIANAYTDFQAKGCVDKYRSPDQSADCDASSCDETYNVSFISLPEVKPTDPGFSVYQTRVSELDLCKSNQSSRRDLEKLSNHLNSADPADYVTISSPKDLANAPTKQIQETVNKYLFDDDLYPEGKNPISNEEKLERSVAIKEKKALIYVYPAGQTPSIMISLLGLRGAKVCHTDPDDGSQDCKDLTQSNDQSVMTKKNGELNEAAMIHDVKWDFKERHLLFTVPDASSSFNSVTGLYEREYRFDLYRVKNIVSSYTADPVTDIAKFTGDLALAIKGVVVRKGSVQILGAMKEFPAPTPTQPDTPPDSSPNPPQVDPPPTTAAPSQDAHPAPAPDAPSSPDAPTPAPAVTPPAPPAPGASAVTNVKLDHWVK